MDMTKEFKDRDSFFHWFLIAALSDVEIDDTVRAEPRMVSMQLNGVELNPKHALKRLEEIFDEAVEHKAAEMIKDVKRDILNPFEDKMEEVTGMLDEFVKANSLIPELNKYLSLSERRYLSDLATRLVKNIDAFEFSTTDKYALKAVMFKLASCIYLE